MESCTADHFDVVIVGAGISGLGAANKLKKLCPSKTFCVLEGRPRLGGTWDYFKYPGIRSDSDMFTFGYEDKPWGANKAIAPAENILSYLQEMVDENGLAEHIRYEHQLASASWKTPEQSWTLEVCDLQCSSFVYNCTINFTPLVLLIYV